MKASLAFIFFMLFLAGIAFVNLRGMQSVEATSITSIDELNDVVWRPTHLGEMNVDDDTDMSLQFNNDSQISGHGGCNRFFASYELKDGKLTFGPLGATRMACPEPAASIELSYFEALSATRTAVRVDRRLALKNDAGQTLLRFVAISPDEMAQ